MFASLNLFPPSSTFQSFAAGRIRPRLNGNWRSSGPIWTTKPDTQKKAGLYARVARRKTLLIESNKIKSHLEHAKIHVGGTASQTLCGRNTACRPDNSIPTVTDGGAVSSCREAFFKQELGNWSGLKVRLMESNVGQF